jgi:hypothetical protein
MLKIDDEDTNQAIVYAKSLSKNNAFRKKNGEPKRFASIYKS